MTGSDGRSGAAGDVRHAVRQLHGEDLDRLRWADAAQRVRSLGEAQILVAEVDEFDYLAACADGRVVGIGAAGYRTPWGGASVVSLAVDPRPGDTDPTAALLARLEQRAGELTCSSVEVRIAAADVDTRAVVEGHGYGLVGATTSLLPTLGHADARERPEEVVERHVDSWVLRKHL